MFHLESQVRSYCNRFPKKFSKAKNAIIYDTDGVEYLDFLSACGSLNYGHNRSELGNALIQHISVDGLAIGLDLETDAKERFLESFYINILKPRGMDYRFQFTGPTGTNAVEAAIKLARKVSNRTNIVAFTNAFHGCSIGALSLTGSSYHRGSSAPALGHVTRMAYDRYGELPVNTADLLAKMLDDPSGGIDSPAAIILETIQGEGGLNVASPEWLQKIEAIARQHGALLIVDDIQSGCGRSGSFFSFETLGIRPDVIILAKSLSGFGLPMSLVLVKPEFDVWKPGEHNGTFRGNNHAFVTATAALECFWKNSNFQIEVGKKIALVANDLKEIAKLFGLRVKGRGFMQGLDFGDGNTCKAVARRCFELGLIIETCGPNDEVLKLFPPLTTEVEFLLKGIKIIRQSIMDTIQTRSEFQDYPENTKQLVF